ncbi:MAG: ABC transporter ATP-binding protein [Telluria sp.]
MVTPRIDVRGASRAYGSVCALDGIDLAVPPGAMVGLIGHNGAGKSTLFKLMLGLVRPDTGAVCIDAVATTAPGFRAVRRRIGYLPEHFATYDNLTGAQALSLFADLKRVPRAACAGVLERVGLAEAAQRVVRGYSKGMRQRLGFAQALLGDPDLVFLDEPTNGLDPEGIHDFYRILRTLRERGATIVITSHILAEIQDRVDRLAVLRAGRLVAAGSLAELRAGASHGVRVDVLAQPGMEERVAAAVAPLGDVTHAPDARVRVACAPGRKMDVLARLTALGAAVRDISLRDASLEELFLGLGGSHGA